MTPWRWLSSATGWPPESLTTLLRTCRQRPTRPQMTPLVWSTSPSGACWATPPPRPPEQARGCLVGAGQLLDTDVDGPGVGYRLRLARRADRRSGTRRGNRVWPRWCRVRLHGWHAHRYLLTLS